MMMKSSISIAIAIYRILAEQGQLHLPPLPQIKLETPSQANKLFKFIIMIDDYTIDRVESSLQYIKD